MRKTLLIMAVALLLIQCRKPAVEFPTAGPANIVSMTITVGPGGKTDISETGAITWSSGDKIYVGHDGRYVGYLTLQSSGGSATGTFSGDVTLPNGTTGEQTFRFFYLGSVDHTGELTPGTSTQVPVSFALQTGLRGDLSSCHVGHGSAEGTVNDGVVSGIRVLMKSEVALSRFSFRKSGETPTPYTGALTLSGDRVYNSMTVDFGGTFTGEKTDGGKINLTNTTVSEKYVMLVPAGADPATLSFGGEYEGSTELAQGIEANMYYGNDEPIDVTVKPIEFTVDADGTKVEFSPGNLQYLGRSDGTGTWRFAEHQWDYMGAGPSATPNKGNVDLGAEYAGKYNTGSGSAGGSETEADKAAARDLFGWGATGYQDKRAHTYQTNYRPYSTSKSFVNTTYNYYGYGPDYDASKYGLSVEDNSDWGCVTGLPSAGEGKSWRTLSDAEWSYLLNTSGSSGRTDANRFAKAKVNGVKGLLIFPDGYALPNGYNTAEGGMGMAKVNKTSSTDAPWPAADIPPVTWASMESAGVVFLPAAGYRSGASLNRVGSYGYYWSSTCYDKSYAYHLCFHPGDVGPQDRGYRYDGCSVRLVR